MISEYLKNAMLMMNAENYSDACNTFLTIISLDPPPQILAEVYFQLGISFLKLCDYNAAEECLLKSDSILLEQGIDANKHIREAFIFLFDNSGQTDRLREYCLKILDSDTADLHASTALAGIYFKEKRYTEAIGIMLPVLEKHPDNQKVLYTCLIAEAKVGMYEPALRHANEYLKKFGTDQQLTLIMGDAYHELGMAKETVAAYEEVYNERNAAEKFKLSEYMLANSLYDEIYDRKKVREILDFRLEYTSGLIKNTCFDNDLRFFKKLNIGYLSDDFCRHPVGYFLMPVFGKRRMGSMNYTCYSSVEPKYKDGVTDYLFGCADSVHDVYDLSDDEIEPLILQDKPDIMMELKSFTKGNRLGLYARRLAPVQVSWIGFPCSTGIAAIDYLITDKHADPYPYAQELYSEKLLYLKDTFLCCKLPVPDSLGVPAFVKNGYITFGCYNNYVKITDRMLKNWSEILGAVKNSKIIFMAKGYKIDYVVQLFNERLIKFGFDVEKVIIKEEVAFDKYYMSYDDIDIVLDTYPFNGATTTFDSLLMGTPLITMVGETHPSRMGLDIISHAGLEDLVCYSDLEYIDKAKSLAGDTERLKYLKKNLRTVMHSSKLCDDRAFNEEYEYALRKAWINYCIKKYEGFAQKKNSSLNELHDELINGCNHILKCVNSGEFTGELRELLLDEFIETHKAYKKTVLDPEMAETNCPGSHIGDMKLFDLICRAIVRLKDVDDGYVIKILEQTLNYLSSCS